MTYAWLIEFKDAKEVQELDAELRRHPARPDPRGAMQLMAIMNTAARA